MNVHKNFIAGNWIEGNTETENISPSDLSDIIGFYSRANADQIKQAIAASKEAFKCWQHSTQQQRFDPLDFVGSEILARKEELGRLLSREVGKILAEGIVEVTRAGQIFKFFAGEALRVEGDTISSVRPRASVEMTREPLGVIGAITPWNFPIAIPAWKIAPALVYGNCVVFKPADLVPGCVWALAEILSRSDLPEGVFNLLIGRGSEVGQTFLENRDFTAVTFTRSVETGRHVVEGCAACGAKFQLEMGGKNPLVVLNDADLETEVECAVNGAFFSADQRCTASSRLIVSRGIHDKFVDAVTERMKGLVVDNALKEGAHIGPAVDESQLNQDLDYLHIGQEEGAHLAYGGKRLNRDPKGFYLEPALFTGAINSTRIAREEIFGPAATFIRVKNYEEALETANDTDFGPSAGICTTSLKYASHFKRNSDADLIMVNLPTAGMDYHVQFGGRKGSSYGPREQGRYASEFYTTVKTAYTLPL